MKIEFTCPKLHTKYHKVRFEDALTDDSCEYFWFLERCCLDYNGVSKQFTEDELKKYFNVDAESKVEDVM